jgi:hypothetical protein
VLTGSNCFAELFSSVHFEDVGKGRQGAVLVKPDNFGRVPLVRTTTRYNRRAQCFRANHSRFANQIQECASLPVSFNHALIENYTNAYTTMASHSDQALDLADASFIALFSCYQHPEILNTPRKLIVEDKEPGTVPIAIPLTHGSVVVFSVETNRQFKHKIVLDSPKPHENLWLGITFRTSASWLDFRNEVPFFADNTRLTLADNEQRREFYRLRSRENSETGFAYPPITYTLSESDLLLPETIASESSVPLDPERSPSRTAP